MADIAIVHTETHDETKPAGSRARSLGDDDIREKDRAVRERLAVDHVALDDETGETAVGIHKKVTMRVIADPTTYADVGYLYLKTVDGVIELFYKDSAGNVIQLSTGGVIKDSVMAKSGDWMFSSVTTARAGWTNVSATYTDKFIRINATPLTTGGADTHTHDAGTLAGPSHTHTGTTGVGSSGIGAYTGSEPTYGKNHVHTFTSDAGGTGSVTGATASANNIPAYVQAVVFQKD